jgi:hypothetical protein
VLVFIVVCSTYAEDPTRQAPVAGKPSKIRANERQTNVINGLRPQPDGRADNM